MSAENPSPQPSPARGEGAERAEVYPERSAAAAFAEVIVSGRVQGVGYREFARRAAERHGVAGFVRNRADGTVEAKLIGTAPAVEATLAEMRRGPPYGRVSELRIVARGEAAAQVGFFVTATV